MEDFELELKVRQFCLLDKKEARYEEIKNPIYKDVRIVKILMEVAEEEQDRQRRQNYFDHIDLINEYQKKGISALDFFVSTNEIHSSFINFAYGFNNFEDRKTFLLSNLFLIDRKSLEYITGLINKEKHLSQRTASRFYRNLLKACRIIGLEKAFAEFSPPDKKYVDAVNSYLKCFTVPDYALFLSRYREEISSKEIRNVFQYMQAEFETDKLKRERIKSA